MAGDRAHDLRLEVARRLVEAGIDGPDLFEFHPCCDHPGCTVLRDVGAAPCVCSGRPYLSDAAWSAIEGAWTRPAAPRPESEAGQSWVHGTRLGRDHRSVRTHLVEDHELKAAEVAHWSDGAVHGWHDRQHGATWAYAADLPHGDADGS